MGMWEFLLIIFLTLEMICEQMFKNCVRLKKCKAPPWQHEGGNENSKHVLCDWDHQE